MEGVTLSDLEGWGGWGLTALLLAWWIRGIPERRRARNEGDGSLRGDLLKRISDLEHQQTVDRDEHARQRAADRKECQEEQEQLRQRLREQEKIIDGLQRQLIMFQLASGRALPPELRSPEIDRALAVLGPLLTAQPAPEEKPQ